ncbi:unnamed protein product [Urochloa decumbens]|uniref:F-box protein AT5G49610-like beta-propeller domain-containing protein n=1 Tax=Urochloa decumbens TaxID=240449 RepID=A0ABC8WCD9_9POAL
MASQEPPPRRRRLPPAMPREPTIPTTIIDLGDDLILDIFLRLPSLPSLVRAAFACRAFLAAVRSSPAFRRRFRELHPPPLLGFFFDPNGSEMPPFTPVRRRADPDLAAAVRGADVFLTRLPCHDDAAPGWELVMCHGGNVVLFSSRTRQIAAYNPLTRALHLVPLPEEIYDSFIFLSSEEAPGSFLVFASYHGKSERRPAIFSSNTMDWRILTLSEPAIEGPSTNWHDLFPGVLLNGSVYWPHKREAYILVLNTSTLQLSRIDLPVDLKGQGHTYMIGETKDGKLCIVSATGFTLSVWFRRANADGVDEWMRDNAIPLEAEVLQATKGSRDNHHALKVWDVIDGIVYLSTFEAFRDRRLPSWFLSFCLETRKLEKLFHKTFDHEVFPYVMAWPPSLVRSNVIP